MSLGGVNWGEGRTAPGSSGSPLYNANHQIVGALCCGSSYCTNDLDDYYGRSLSGSWNLLSQYLDPSGSGVSTLSTLNLRLTSLGQLGSGIGALLGPLCRPLTLGGGLLGLTRSFD